MNKVIMGNCITCDEVRLLRNGRCHRCDVRAASELSAEDVGMDWSWWTLLAFALIAVGGALAIASL